jgi:hypothetical protein
MAAVSAKWRRGADREIGRFFKCDMLGNSEAVGAIRRGALMVQSMGGFQKGKRKEKKMGRGNYGVLATRNPRSLYE